ncbi:MAG TPA: glycosyltransferase [Solirubrobacteraceae bacterium]
MTIDGRSLTAAIGGTQTYVTDLIVALATNEQIALRVLIAADIPKQTDERLRDLAIETITYEEAIARPVLSDVVHRPQQVFTVDDLRLLQLVGKRIVIGQQDLIAYHIPTYHKSADIWQRHRRATRLALEIADRVVFFSTHAMHDAIAENLVSHDRCEVVGLGVDQPGNDGGHVRAQTMPIEGISEDEPLLVCLGADYAHKNRPFAIALVAALARRHGWRGRLVLAGGHVTHGSSADEERILLKQDPLAAELVIDVGQISEQQRAWLLEHASAIVYPTIYEGFGLLPFEAQAFGLPCIFAAQTSLKEHLEQAATIVPWNPDLSADTAIALLQSGPQREHHMRLLAQAAERYRWHKVVEQLLCCYRKALADSPRSVAPYAWQDLEQEAVRAEAEHYRQAYSDLMVNRDTALPLVAHGGLLSEAEQRGLMRIASRSLLHSLILHPIGLLGGIKAPARKPETTAVVDRERDQPTADDSQPR